MTTLVLFSSNVKDINKNATLYITEYATCRATKKSLIHPINCSALAYDTAVTVVASKWFVNFITFHKEVQEAQLLQGDRATLRPIEYFAKSLEVTQGHSK